MVDVRRQPLQSPHARGGCKRRKPRHEPHTRGLNTKIHLAVDTHGLPVRVVVTQDTDADCTHAAHRINGLSADDLLADKGDDTDAIVDRAKRQGMIPVIPPKKNRIAYDLMTRFSTRSAILLQPLFFTSKDGAEALHTMPKTSHPSSPPSRSDAPHSGLKSRDYSIYTLFPIRPVALAFASSCCPAGHGIRSIQTGSALPNFPSLAVIPPDESRRLPVT